MLAVAGCSDAEQPATLAFEVSGRLEDPDILEASGLARSHREPGLLWVINDNGAKEIVHALDTRGNRRGEFKLKGSDNKDWEDLASFKLEGIPYLMVADIGDNDAKRKKRTLYVVEEPVAAEKSETTFSWQVSYQYPDGPRDAEAAAVDLANRKALILSKRDMPPRLYEVPLLPDTPDTVTATALGAIQSLDNPSRQDIEFAPKTKDWYWQPVGMDISDDGIAAVILTYRAVYYYRRQPGQSWFDALNMQPVRIGIGNFENAEAVAFGDEHRTVYVTGENKHSLIITVDLAGASRP
ncbi:MAG TPA: hypothetical protein PKH39_04945 [Woeseiaceae bacterium]|nr:hypothetical protein [Woeseiaceae bacterium]